MKMPKVIWMRIDDYGTDAQCLLAFETVEAAVDGDGPTTVGLYRLVETIKRKKVVVEAK